MVDVEARVERAWNGLRHAPGASSLSMVLVNRSAVPPSIRAAKMALPNVQRSEIIDFIKSLPLDNLRDNGVMVGINNHAMGADGQRIGNAPLFVALRGIQWQRTLSTLGAIGVTCTALKVNDNWLNELENVHASELVTATFWGLELQENVTGQGSGDPRSQIIPKALFDVTWPLPLVYVYVQVQLAISSNDGPMRSESPTKIRPPRQSLLPQVYEEHEMDEPIGNDPVQLRKKADELEKRARLCGSLGDESTAYELVVKANYLTDHAESIELAEAETTAETPTPTVEAEAEPDDFFPDVSYVYPDGEVRTIEAGRYTTSEHLSRSMIEHERLLNAKAEHERMVERARITNLGKYATPLTRSLSDAEAITTAELLKSEIVQNAEFARSAYAASHESSPVLGPSEGPPPLDASAVVDIGKSLADVDIANDDVGVGVYQLN